MLTHCVALLRACILLFALGASSLVAAAAFTTGNLAVYRVGDGTATLVNTGNAVFIDEYTPTGTLVQSIALPTTVSGAQRQLIASGTATSEGLMSRSADGQCLWLTGYARDVGVTGSISATTAAAVPRVVGRVASNGTADTTTALTDYASTNNPRSAAAADCNNVWISGGTGGIGYVALGAATMGTSISSTVTPTPVNLRQLGVAGSQLYVSTGSGTAVRIGTVGTGLPTNTGNTIANLPGFATSGEPYAFFFADLSASVPGVDTLYVASDDAGALTKYSLVSGSWVSNGAVGVNADDYRGITGVVTGTSVTLYATRLSTQLVSLTDTSGYNGSFAGTPTLLASSGTNKAFRGVALAPEGAPAPPSVTLSLSTANASEAAQTVVTVTATASSAVATAQTVTVAVSGTNITAGDYILSSTTITIPAFGTVGTATVSIVDDADIEGLETATIAISNPSAGITLGSTTSISVSITDNDTANTAPVISAIPPLAVVMTLADNPTTSFTVSDGESAPGSLIVTVLGSSNPSVAPVANVTLSNVTGTVTAAVTPLAVGYADITVQVSDGVLSSTGILRLPPALRRCCRVRRAICSAPVTRQPPLP